MPLTIDSLTLTCLFAQASLWLKRRRAACSLLLLSASAGCVPSTRFEEAQSAAQVEMEGRRRAEHEITQLQASNQQLASQLRQQHSQLDQGEEALARAQFDTTTLGKQREDAEGLVEQLRGELARAGEHLRSVSDDKQKIEAAIFSEAERGRNLSLVSRDVALMLSEPVATGAYELLAEQRGIVVRVPRDKLLAEDGALKPESAPLLKTLAHVLGLYPALRISVEDSRAKLDPTALTRVDAALKERGIAAERFAAPSDPAQSNTPPAAGEANAARDELTFILTLP